MRSRVRENVFVAVVAGLTVYVVGWLTLYGWGWTDYDNEARPAFDALAGGHLLHFLQLAPAYGGSLVLRAPFVLATGLWHGGDLAIYRAAAVPALLASAAFGVWLVARMRARGCSRGARAVALFLCIANPITLPAFEIGHPEELLGAVLCVAAVLVAVRNRPVWAGVLLGLAIANKEWAILATGPVLIALPEQRWRSLLAAAGAAGIVLGPLVLASSSGFVGQQVAATKTGTVFQPWQIWWFLGSHGHIVRGYFGNIHVGYRTPPGWIGQVTHPLIVAISVPLTLLCMRLRRRAPRRAPNDAMLLLVLLLLLRCVLDAWDYTYYALPFLIALVTWEVLTYRRPPVLALAASFATWFVFQAAASPNLNISADMQSLIFDAFAISAVLAIAAGLYAPGLSKRLAFRMRRRPVPLGPALGRAEAA